MKIKISIALSAFVLAGCENPAPPTGGYYDQDIRRDVFFECLKSLPNGPNSTKYNDWSEVVEECGTQAYYISARGFRNTRAKVVP